MKNVPDTALGKMYKEHIQLILDKNVDGLLDQYTDDAVLISTDHSSYDYDEIVKHAQLVIDTRNATKQVTEGREKIRKA